jgi:hypothetical protein
MGQSRSLYDRGREEFLNSFALGTISRSASSFARNWETGTTGDVQKSRLIEDIDRAAEAELGLTITELMEFLAEGINAGSRRPGSAKISPHADFVAEMASGLNWDTSKIDRAFELLSLRPRGPFLTPPPPFRAADVYPWRFNRALSYLRRPFLVRRLGSLHQRY